MSQELWLWTRHRHDALGSVWLARKTVTQRDSDALPAINVNAARSESQEGDRRQLVICTPILRQVTDAFSTEWVCVALQVHARPVSHLNKAEMASSSAVLKSWPDMVYQHRRLGVKRD